jgi:hypothetical protein
VAPPERKAVKLAATQLLLVSYALKPQRGAMMLRKIAENEFEWQVTQSTTHVSCVWPQNLLDDSRHDDQYRYSRVTAAETKFSWHWCGGDVVLLLVVVLVP